MYLMIHVILNRFILYLNHRWLWNKTVRQAAGVCINQTDGQISYSPYQSLCLYRTVKSVLYSKITCLALVGVQINICLLTCQTSLLCWQFHATQHHFHCFWFAYSSYESLSSSSTCTLQVRNITIKLCSCNRLFDI